MRQTGGLILLAEQWRERTDGIEWPKCFDCEDTGKIVPQSKKPNSVVSACAPTCNCVLEATYGDKPASNAGFVFVGFKILAKKAGMLASDIEWEEIETIYWPALSPSDQKAAAQGIVERESTEWIDRAFVPLAVKYIVQRLWTRPIRPAPKTKSDLQRERTDEIFRDRTIRDLERGEVHGGFDYSSMGQEIGEFAEKVKRARLDKEFPR
jgi:hypothetical protein